MSELFFIADLHLGHRNILRFEGGRQEFASSVEEHDEKLVDNWNKVVTKNDTVWVLGDVAFGKESLKHVGRMHGYKRLVLGNHDHYATESYLQYFNKVYGAATTKEGWILTHIPVHPSQLDSRFTANVHGHLHRNTIPDPRYQCVSVERTDYAPISYEEVCLRNEQARD
jgi:calcineurin-like phosphoesterase family protein